MKKYIAVLLVALLGTVTLTVNAHGGGLDSSGCHTDHSTGNYHCHR